MQSVLRSIRAQPQPTQKILPSPRLPSKLSTPGIVRFQKSAAGGTSRPKSDGERMDKAAGKEEKGMKGDTMSSFGEGYATRSEEEGFGGIYRGNQEQLEKEEEEKEKDIHKHSPEFDHQQGSEVKEKETSRHQKDANA